jgi:hypothetical protein
VGREWQRARRREAATAKHDFPNIRPLSISRELYKNCY